MKTIYDKLAPMYDERYSTPECLAENQRVFGFLAPHATGSVLDIGNGTGILLDYLRIKESNYLGMDPSKGMVDRFAQKHPNHKTQQMLFEEYAILKSKRDFDLSVALFGAASYVSEYFYEHLLWSGKDYFFMFYKPGYLPDYYTNEAVKTNYDRLRRIFGNLHTFNNFVVASSLGGVGENL